MNEIAPKWDNLHQTFEQAVGETHSKMIDEITEKIKIGLSQLNQ